MPPTDDNSILELRGAAVEWLGSGGQITIQGVEYEYADSDADDDSIDDAVGPGRTFGKLVKRMAASVEMFLSFCSDLLGNGPDAIFTRLMRRNDPLDSRYRRTKRLSWWIKDLAYIFPPIRLGVYRNLYHNRDISRLVQFVIDRRYHISVRLTAAYYLLILLKFSRLCAFVPLFHDVLSRICQEGSRHGIKPSTLRPLQEVLTFKEDLMCITTCDAKEVPAVIIGSSEDMASSLVHYFWVWSLGLQCLRIHTRSDLEAVEQANQVVGSRLYRLAPDPNPLECALKLEVQKWYEWVDGDINDKRMQFEMREFMEHIQYIIPCGTEYGNRYRAI
ncbi:hypothetical protein OE88DRAFT_1669232 [Heliocybe sulcata]|uniref:Uncharacterized protein n=1 Tax=Heliocybe sulcata TaxID=5364 RepID=A0A5C3ML15_9AGAM|nr:hypothetical protein OE88DRAFT_1669232 [Heliocybe sulcata]